MSDKKLSLQRIAKLPRKGKSKEKLTKGKVIKRILKYTLIFFVLMFIVGSIGLTVLIIKYSKELPSPGQPFTRAAAESTQIYDRNGKLLYTLYQDQNREYVKLSDVDKNMQWAMLSAEDVNFYQEQTGISPLGIARSLLYDALHKGNSLQGASTITQQLVKETVLTSDRTISRKIKEAILTVEVSAKFSKDQVLEAYLNEIPFGGEVYGIQAAAKTYFGIPASQLDLAQAAMLAGLPQAPSVYSPLYGSDPDAGKQRQLYVLNEMLKHKDLTGVTQAQVDAAEKEVLHYQNASVGDELAPHFVNYVVTQLDNKYGQDYVDTQGLQVTTTLDYNMQQLAQQAVTGAVNDLIADKMNSHNGALITLDATNGEVMAMVGSYEYGVDLGPTMQGDTNVTLSPRQPGSSIKPLLYATAFQNLGLAPASFMPDIPITVGNYSPMDWNNIFEGPLTIRQALGQSRNNPAVMALYSVGTTTFVDQMRKFGYTVSDQYLNDLSIAVGSTSVPLIEHAAAYEPFANGGTLYPTTSILSIKDKNGKVIYTYDPTNAGKQVIDPKYTYLITDVLKSYSTLSAVSTGHSGRIISQSPLQAGFHIAAKDGTSNDNIDLVVMGYTPKYVTGMWDGNNDNTPTAPLNYPVQIAPYWNKYMMAISQPYKSLNFTKPAGIVTESVCADTGLLATSSTPCNKVNEIFSATQIPKQDDEHVTVQVCKENPNYLATQAQIDAGDYINKTYVYLKTFNAFFQPSLDSFMKGSNVAPPTQTCDGATPTAPGNTNITFNSPSQGQTFSPGSKITIQISLNGLSNVSNVEFSFNGSPIPNGTVSNAPYQLEFTIPSNTPSGTYSIIATVTQSDGTQISDSENINVSGASQSSSSVSVTSQSGTFHQYQHAQLSGQFSGITTSISEAGFYYQSSSCSNAKCTLTSNGTSGNNFSYDWNLNGLTSGNYQIYSYVKSNGVEYDSTNSINIIVIP